MKMRGGRRLDEDLIDLGIVDFGRTAAARTDEQDAVMMMARIVAGNIGLLAFDFDDEAVFDEKIERTIDRRRRDGAAFDLGEMIHDLIGPDGLREISQNRDNLPPQWRQLQALRGADLFDLFDPALARRRPPRWRFAVSFGWYGFGGHNRDSGFAFGALISNFIVKCRRKSPANHCVVTF